VAERMNPVREEAGELKTDFDEVYRFDAGLL
jgi:hypothetical protein